MGHKHAPQAPGLADQSFEDHNGSDSNGPVDDPARSAVALRSSPSPDSAASAGSGSRSQRLIPGVGAGSSGEISRATPTSSQSPRSPGSLSSKFNTSKKPQDDEVAEAPLQPRLATARALPKYKPRQFDRPPPGRYADRYDQDSYHSYHQELASSGHHPRKFSNASQQSLNSALREGPEEPQPSRQRREEEKEKEKEKEKHTRSGSRFFNFNKPPKQAHHLHHANRSAEALSRSTAYPAMSDRGSNKNSKSSDTTSADQINQNNATSSISSKPDQSIGPGSGNTENDAASSSRKNKPKPFGLLNRTKSLKDKDRDGTSMKQPKDSAQSLSQGKLQEPERAHTTNPAEPQPLKTAPVQPEGHDRAFRHMMNNTPRNHSADRAATRDTPGNKESRSEKDHHYRNHAQSFKDNSGSAFFTGLRSSGTKAADMISKGLFGSRTRTENSIQRPSAVDDEHYQLKVINLPLVEQTRITRISKRLEESRDKTEFWMPAFPWRAIDYLNYKGSDIEGLYRVPGSGPQIKKWQRKFDEEYDVDLFAQDDLYDINIIGSMLKAWLRELPDELLPKEAQDRIARECAGAETVPQLLIDELSKLTPYQYYLLFAITCHLSLLLAHTDKNKMDFRNLCICFQPCMKIDTFCFRFLVCDWRQCWQGCKTEAKFIEEEYQLFHSPPPRALGGGVPLQQHEDGAQGNEQPDERVLSSAQSSKPSMQGHEQPPQQPPRQNGKLRKKTAPGSTSSNTAASVAAATGLTIDSDREASLDTPRGSNDLRPLSPIKPLSPMGGF